MKISCRHRLLSALALIILCNEGRSAASMASSSSLSESSQAVLKTVSNKNRIPTSMIELSKWMWEGGVDSVAGRSICAAEGNCNSDGSLTSIAYGHVDPGNHVNNMGRFSYQMYLSGRTDMTIEEADTIQMQKLLAHTQTLVERAQKNEVELTLDELLNGVDVANQCPLCLTEAGGFVERLKEAYQEKGLKGLEAIEYARTFAYWDDSKGGFDAPGLRAYDDQGKETSIRKDVQRRMDEIEDASKRKLKELTK
jgi:hypothetical protein